MDDSGYKEKLLRSNAQAPQSKIKCAAPPVMPKAFRSADAGDHELLRGGPAGGLAGAN